MRIKIGTRGSLLAKIQVDIVADQIKKYYPETDIEVVIITTEGDVRADAKLSDIGGKGLFVQEIEKSLTEGKIDIAVHSGKDLPSRLDDGFSYHCITPREDVADVLVCAERYDGLSEDNIYECRMTIGTASPRREALIKKYMPNSQVKHLRGNVPTRIEKLKNTEYDGIILAQAGINRLKNRIDLEGLRLIKLSPDKFIPAAAQGIIVCQTMKDTRYHDMLCDLRDANTQKAFELEKEALVNINADCHDPAGAYAVYTGEEWRVLTFSCV